MKKSLVIAAAAMIGASAFAQTVTSANIVGYAKKSVAASAFQILSPQFQDGTAGGVVLSNAFSGVTDQSKVYTWDGSTYTTYTYYAGYGWHDQGFTPADGIQIDSGDAVWFEGSTAGDVIMSGEVPLDASITVTLVPGFNLISSPYPVDTELGDLPTNVLSDQDKIYTWDGSTYTTYTYYAGYGWHDQGFTPADTVSINVGNGVWMESATGGSLVINKSF